MNIKITKRSLKVETKDRVMWLFADYIGWGFIYLIPSLWLDLHHYNGNITIMFGFLCFDFCIDIYKTNNNIQ